MAEKVTWTEEETEKLINLVMHAQMIRPEETLLMHLRSAQEQLPESRRRTIVAYTGVSKFLRAYKDFLARQYKRWKDQEKEIQSLTDRLKNAKGEAANLVATEAMGLAAYSMTQLADELSKRLHNQDKPVVQEQPKAVQRKRLVICIYGPLSPQQETINGAIDDIETQTEVIVKFIDSSKAVVPKGCDYYIIWTKFANHSVEGTMQSFAKKDCFIRVDTMRSLLEMVETVIQTH